MSSCPNCKATLSCGCQKKKATNGVFVCKNCIQSYENSIKVLTDTIKSAEPKTSGLNRYNKK